MDRITGDRPAHETNPEEIEITPEMVRAGCRILWDSGVTEYRMEADELIVSEIFVAMPRPRPD